MSADFLWSDSELHSQLKRAFDSTQRLDECDSLSSKRFASAGHHCSPDNSNIELNPKVAVSFGKESLCSFSSNDRSPLPSTLTVGLNPANKLHNAYLKCMAAAVLKCKNKARTGTAAAFKHHDRIPVSRHTNHTSAESDGPDQDRVQCEAANESELVEAMHNTLPCPPYTALPPIVQLSTPTTAHILPTQHVVPLNATTNTTTITNHTTCSNTATTHLPNSTPLLPPDPLRFTDAELFQIYREICKFNNLLEPEVRTAACVRDLYQRIGGMVRVNHDRLQSYWEEMCTQGADPLLFILPMVGERVFPAGPARLTFTPSITTSASTTTSTTTIAVRGTVEQIIYSSFNVLSSRLKKFKPCDYDYAFHHCSAPIKSGYIAYLAHDRLRIYNLYAALLVPPRVLPLSRDATRDSVCRVLYDMVLTVDLNVTANTMYGIHVSADMGIQPTTTINVRWHGHTIIAAAVITHISSVASSANTTTTTPNTYSTATTTTTSTTYITTNSTTLPPAQDAIPILPAHVARIERDIYDFNLSYHTADEVPLLYERLASHIVGLNGSTLQWKWEKLCYTYPNLNTTVLPVVVRQPYSYSFDRGIVAENNATTSTCTSTAATTAPTTPTTLSTTLPPAQESIPILPAHVARITRDIREFNLSYRTADEVPLLYERLASDMGLKGSKLRWMWESFCAAHPEFITCVLPVVGRPPEIVVKKIRKRVRKDIYGYTYDRVVAKNTMNARKSNTPATTNNAPTTSHSASTTSNTSTTL